MDMRNISEETAWTSVSGTKFLAAVLTTLLIVYGLECRPRLSGGQDSRYNQDVKLEGYRGFLLALGLQRRQEERMRIIHGVWGGG